MSKKQKIFFWVFIMFLFAVAAVSVFVGNQKETGGNFALPQISRIESVNSAAVSGNVANAQPAVRTAKEIPAAQKPAVLPAQTQNTPSVLLHAGDVSIVLNPGTGATLFDLLSNAGDAGEIIFTGKQYSGLGFYVTSIGSLRESVKNHLFYYINGKPAAVGISSYIPKDGDVIDWKLE